MTLILSNRRIAKRIGTEIGSTYNDQSLTTTPISVNPYANASKVVPAANEVPAYNNKPQPVNDKIILGSLPGKIPNTETPPGYVWVNIGSANKPQWSLQRSVPE
jgi:hypothetical protein